MRFRQDSSTDLPMTRTRPPSLTVPRGRKRGSLRRRNVGDRSEQRASDRVHEPQASTRRSAGCGSRASDCASRWHVRKTPDRVGRQHGERKRRAKGAHRCHCFLTTVPAWSGKTYHSVRCWRLLPPAEGFLLELSSESATGLWPDLQGTKLLLLLSAYPLL
jgi:hypothetical protein